MNVKLTLTIEQSVIESAKRYAKSKEHSLSGLIENYLRAITKDVPKSNNELTPIVKLLKGSFRATKDFNYKKELTDRLSNKYL